MSYLVAAPDAFTTAASGLSGVGAALESATAAAAPSTTNVVAAAQDEISTAIATLFGTHAQEFNALTAQAATFHNQFVQTLNAGASSYALTEAANTAPLQTLEQDLLGAINAPTEFLLNRPLIGNGTNGTPGTGAAGGNGGLLIGNGGNGASGAPGQAGGAGGSAGLIGNGGFGGAGGADSAGRAPRLDRRPAGRNPHAPMVGTLTPRW
ncbi:PE family protein [Mycobacterium bohemicum]|nr:PE family protein [Mycobacterium bohemicum]